MTVLVRLLVSAALLCAAVLAAGCGREIPGNAVPLGSGGGTVRPDFDKLLRECEVLTEEQMRAAIGKDVSFDETFVGAICMWDLIGAPGGNGLATLSWYENGSLNVERQTYTKLGYSSTIIQIQGASALEVRRPQDSDSCGVIAKAADAGVIGWWINYRAGSAHPDPCPVAAKLVELTLDRAR